VPNEPEFLRIQRRLRISYGNMVIDFSMAQRERLLLAPYAMHSTDSRGRRYPEPEHPYRGPFQRDRDRIVHSAAYRRLSDKTQVFTGARGDYHRTRLTHTYEVASIARTLGRALRLNEDLIEALALLHDIGHPPFGHCGEDVLDECLRDSGGFDHNRQALRIVESLETRYCEFAGLNLTFEVLDGQAFRCEKDDEGPPSPLLEVQVVEAADSIAYNTHDADDALELGLLQLDQLLEVPLWSDAHERLRTCHPDLGGDDLRRAILHELIDWQVGDLLEQAARRLDAGRLERVEDVRQADTIIAPSDLLAEKKEQLEAFLFERVYRHPAVMAERSEIADVLRAMFDGYARRTELMPPKYRSRLDADGLQRTIGDYIAGMTDRYALREYERLFAK